MVIWGATLLQYLITVKGYTWDLLEVLHLSAPTCCGHSQCRAHVEVSLADCTDVCMLQPASSHAAVKVVGRLI